MTEADLYLSTSRLLEATEAVKSGRVVTRVVPVAARLQSPSDQHGVGGLDHNPKIVQC